MKANTPAKKWFNSLTEDEQIQVMETTNSNHKRMNWVDICFTYPKEIDTYNRKSAISELVFALVDVCNHLEWEHSGSRTEKAYDHARNIIKKYSKETI